MNGIINKVVSAVVCTALVLSFLPSRVALGESSDLSVRSGSDGVDNRFDEPANTDAATIGQIRGLIRSLFPKVLWMSYLNPVGSRAVLIPRILARGRLKGIGCRQVYLR